MRIIESLLAVVLVATVAGCRRETRKLRGPAFQSAIGDHALPGPGTVGPYDGNAWAMGEGQRLWNQMNCVGCHSHGGGGMGPPLMDVEWLYGSDDGSVFVTIVNGRPKGMPAFRSRLTDDQVWQLVAYVRSLGGRASSQVASVRDDHMSLRPGPARTDLPPVSPDGGAP